MYNEVETGNEETLRFRIEQCVSDMQSAVYALDFRLSLQKRLQIVKALSKGRKERLGNIREIFEIMFGTHPRVLAPGF